MRFSINDLLAATAFVSTYAGVLSLLAADVRRHGSGDMAIVVIPVGLIIAIVMAVKTSSLQQVRARQQAVSTSFDWKPQFGLAAIALIAILMLHNWPSIRLRVYCILGLTILPSIHVFVASNSFPPWKER